MSITGHVFSINDAKAFFTPILLGQGTPATGFSPAGGAKITVKFQLPLPFPIELSLATTTVHADGSFTLPDLPAGFAAFGTPKAAFLVTFLGQPVYRSGWFPASHTKEPRKMFFSRQHLPDSDGISAGQISSVLNGSGLPGNTTISAGAHGLEFVGSEGQASVKFGLHVNPDSSPVLTRFFDLVLSSWDIEVGFPTDIFKSAGDILDDIKSELGTADQAADKLVAKKLLAVLDGPPINLPELLNSAFLKDVSIVFSSVSLPHKHTWGIGATKDSTIVLVPQPSIGFPRVF